MAHVFEKLLGELVLFFMDLTVAQNGGTILYRFHDDLWLAGKPSQCAAAWKCMEKFANVMGLEFNKHKTGSVYLTDGKCARDTNVLKTLPEGPVAINFLVLDPNSGTWVIDQKHVQEHVLQLQKQLTASNSVLQWIKTWNSCVSRFFSYTFGEPAHCFGLDHLDKILRTHTNMQNFLFNNEDTGNTVGKHIKHMISRKFDTDDVPDSFLFMPESLGGLGLKNPFIPLLLLRNEVCKDPKKRMIDFHKKEREQYETAKQEFEALSERERRKRYKVVFHIDEDEGTEPLISWKNAQKFMSFEDFIKYREYTSKSLYDTYVYLLGQPKQGGVWKSDRVDRVKVGAREYLDFAAEPELLWTVQFFETELFEKYGGLEVVDKSLLPMGVLKALKSMKVTWSMIL